MRGRCKIVQDSKNNREEVMKLYEDEAKIDAVVADDEEDDEVIRAKPPKNARNKN